MRFGDAAARFQDRAGAAAGLEPGSDRGEVLVNTPPDVMIRRMLVGLVEFDDVERVVDHVSRSTGYLAVALSKAESEAALLATIFAVLGQELVLGVLLGMPDGD
jgi:hypothetical protein